MVLGGGYRNEKEDLKSYRLYFTVVRKNKINSRTIALSVTCTIVNFAFFNQ